MTSPVPPMNVHPRAEDAVGALTSGLAHAVPKPAHRTRSVAALRRADSLVADVPPGSAGDATSVVQTSEPVSAVDAQLAMSQPLTADLAEVGADTLIDAPIDALLVDASSMDALSPAPLAGQSWSLVSAAPPEMGSPAPPATGQHSPAEAAPSSWTLPAIGAGVLGALALGASGGSESDPAVRPTNIAPGVSGTLGAQMLPSAGGTVDVSAIRFTDPDQPAGTPLSVRVLVDDQPVSWAHLDTQGHLIVEPGHPGTYSLTLQATDASGARVSSAPFQLTVTAEPAANHAPTVSNPLDDLSLASGYAEQHIPLAGVFRDADGDPLTYTVTVTDAANRPVDNIARVVDGALIIAAGVAPGQYSVRVAATDGMGATVNALTLDIQPATVPVNHAPTVPHPLVDLNLAGGYGEQRIDLADVFADADPGTTLQYHVQATDENGQVVATLASIVDGRLVIAAGAAPGRYHVTLHASDGQAQTSDDLILTVQPAAPTGDNHAPVAIGHVDNVLYASAQSTSQTLGLLSELFTDPDSDPLEVSLIDGSGDNAPLPGWLSVRVDAAGQVMLDATSVPEDAQFGTRILTLVAADSQGASAQLNFSFTLNNPPVPREESVAEVRVVQGEQFRVSLGQIDSLFFDSDGDNLTVRLVTVNGGEPPGWLHLERNGQELFLAGEAPVEGALAELALVASDSLWGGSRPLHIPFSSAPPTQSDQAPVVAQPLANDKFAVNEDAASTLNLADIFADPQGQTLTYAVREVDEAGQTLPAIDGFMTVAGETLTFNPLQAQVGGHHVVVTATDIDGNHVDYAFTLEVANVNDPPIAIGTIQDVVFQPGHALHVNLGAYGDLFTEEDGDVITDLSLSVGHLDGTSEPAPSWLHLGVDEGGQFILYGNIPQDVQIEAYPLILTVTDEHGGAASLGFHLLPNHPPTRTGSIEQVLLPNEGGTIDLRALHFADVDQPAGIPLAISALINNQPVEWVHFNATDNLVTVDPGHAGGYWLDVVASDQFGATVEAPIWLSIPGPGGVIAGTPGDDVFVNSAGDDVYVGAGGTDTLVLSGQYSDYRIDKTPAGLSIADARPASEGGQGTDLFNVSESWGDHGGSLAFFDGVQVDLAWLDPSVFGIVFIEVPASVQSIAGHSQVSELFDVRDSTEIAIASFDVEDGDVVACGAVFGEVVDGLPDVGTDIDPIDSLPRVLRGGLHTFSVEFADSTSDDWQSRLQAALQDLQIDNGAMSTIVLRDVAAGEVCIVGARDSASISDGGEHYTADEFRRLAIVQMSDPEDVMRFDAYNLF